MPRVPALKNHKAQRVVIANPYEREKPLGPQTKPAYWGRTDDVDKKLPDFDPKVPLYPFGDGLFRVYNVKEGPALPDGQYLPGLNDYKMQQERAKQGFKLKRFEKPVIIGPVDEKTYDTTAWADDINKELEKLTDAVPRAPFVWLLVGGIGKGKTTLLNNILKIYEPFVKEFYIISPTLKRDSTLQELMFNRIPGFKIKVDSKPDIAYLQAKSLEVDLELSDAYKEAEMGRFQSAKAKTYFRHLQQDFHNPRHPYVNEEGRHHGEMLRLPNYSSSMEHLSTLGRRSRLGAFEPASLKRGGKGYTSLSQQLLGSKNKLKALKDKAWTGKTLDTDAVTPLEHALTLNVEEPDMRALQVRQQMERNKDMVPGASKDLGDRRGFGLIIDDGAKVFEGPDKLLFERLVSQTRHSRMLMWIGIQQTSSTPRMPRTCATDVTLFSANNEKELKLIEEEFGGNVQNFRSAYYAATAPIGDCTRDFMHIHLPTGRVSRGFMGTLEPVEE